MTDELTMADWDPPFPFDAKRIRPADEAVLESLRANAQGVRVAGDRPPACGAAASDKPPRSAWLLKGTEVAAGQPPNVRLRRRPPSHWSRLLQQHLDPAAMGFVFQPIRAQQLAASKGATPFGVLFLCFSFFIIAAAVMLVALLFRLGIDRRAVQIGTLLAVGLSRRKVRRMLVGRRARRGRRRQPVGRARRNRLRRADAPGPANLVAGRHRDAILAAPCYGHEFGDRLRERSRRGDRRDLALSSKDRSPAAAAACWPGSTLQFSFHRTNLCVASRNPTPLPVA